MNEGGPKYEGFGIISGISSELIEWLRQHGLDLKPLEINPIDLKCDPVVQLTTNRESRFSLIERARELARQSMTDSTSS